MTFPAAPPGWLLVPAPSMDVHASAVVAAEWDGSSVRGRDDHGQATVWAIGWIAVLVSLTWVTLLLEAGVARQHRLDGAADLTAVSAAGAQERGLDACRTASRLAKANHVTLSDCTVDGFDVIVSVVDDLALPGGISVDLTSQARAGPA